MAFTEPYNYPTNEYWWNKTEKLNEALRYVHDRGVSDDIKLVRALTLSRGDQFQMPDGSGKMDDSGRKYSAQRVFNDFKRDLPEFKKKLQVIFVRNSSSKPYSKYLMAVENVEDYEEFMKYEYERIWEVELNERDVQTLLYTTGEPQVVIDRKRKIAETFEFSNANSNYKYQRFATYQQAYDYFHDSSVNDDGKLVRMTVMMPGLVGRDIETAPVDSLVQYMVYGGGLELLKSRYGNISTVSELEDKLLQLARSNGRFMDNYGLDFKLMDLYMDLFVAQYTNSKFDTLEAAEAYIHDKTVQPSARITRAIILGRANNTDDDIATQVDQIQPVLQHMNTMYNIRRVTDF